MDKVITLAPYVLFIIAFISISEWIDTDGHKDLWTRIKSKEPKEKKSKSKSKSKKIDWFPIIFWGFWVILIAAMFGLLPPLPFIGGTPDYINCATRQLGGYELPAGQWEYIQGIFCD